jgi:hypothetical protein
MAQWLRWVPGSEDSLMEESHRQMVAIPKDLSRSETPHYREGAASLPACQLPTGSSPCTSRSANSSIMLRSYASCRPRRRVTKQETLESGLAPGFEDRQGHGGNKHRQRAQRCQGHRDAGGADSGGGQLGHGHPQRLSCVGVTWWVQLAWEMTAIASKASTTGRSVKSPAIRCRCKTARRPEAHQAVLPLARQEHGRARPPRPAWHEVCRT